MNKLYLEIRILGDNLNTNEITTLLSMTPTRSYLKGDSIGRRGKLAETNGWELVINSGPDYVGIDEMIINFVQRVSSCESKFTELTIGCDKAIGVVLKMLDPTGPGFYLPSEELRKIGNLGFAIDVDLYRE